jgi:hypothetical protein
VASPSLTLYIVRIPWGGTKLAVTRGLSGFGFSKRTHAGLNLLFLACWADWQPPTQPSMPPPPVDSDTIGQLLCPGLTKVCTTTTDHRSCSRLQRGSRRPQHNFRQMLGTIFPQLQAISSRIPTSPRDQPAGRHSSDPAWSVPASASLSRQEGGIYRGFCGRLEQSRRRESSDRPPASRVRSLRRSVSENNLRLPACQPD